jgi:hypothetical protein
MARWERSLKGRHFTALELSRLNRHHLSSTLAIHHPADHGVIVRWRFGPAGRVRAKPIPGRSLIGRIDSLFGHAGNLASNSSRHLVFSCHYWAQRHTDASFPCKFPTEQGNRDGFAGDCFLRHLTF